MTSLNIPEADTAAVELNALCRELEERAEANPQVVYWFKRLLAADDPRLADEHIATAVAMAVLPRPSAHLPDGRPLFTFQQVAAALGFEIGGLYRKASELPAVDIARTAN